MKNKIFELYKPESLENFLAFSQSNPKERFVYVVQQPAPNINILSASDYGYLVICLPNRDQAIYSTAPYTLKMKKNLQDFRKEDYLLAVGDPVIIGISTAVVSDVTNGQFNMLKWDKREYRYYPLEVDMYQKDNNEYKTKRLQFNVREEMLKDSTDLLDNVEVTTIAQECVKLKAKEDEIAKLEEQLKSKKTEADDISSRVIPNYLQSKDYQK